MYQSPISSEWRLARRYALFHPRTLQHFGEVFESPGHSPGTLELLNVETDALTLKLVDSEHLVQAGSSVLARTEEKHAYMNCGNDELRFVMAVAELQRPRVRTGL